jgi:hypothetical protein
MALIIFAVVIMHISAYLNSFRHISMRFFMIAGIAFILFYILLGKKSLIKKFKQNIQEQKITYVK